MFQSQLTTMFKVSTAYSLTFYSMFFACASAFANEGDFTDNSTSLFNGKDLTGWKAEGGAQWKVENGVLIGTQGPNNEPGDLLSENTYRDFQLKVTFKVVWPANTGIWYRYQSAQQAYQADILEHKKPFALTGSLYCTGKMFLQTNTNSQMANRDGWNTMDIRVAGNHHQVSLNGKPVVDVRDDTSDHGRIGFQVHAGNQFANMQVHIKSIDIIELQSKPK